MGPPPGYGLGFRSAPSSDPCLAPGGRLAGGHMGPPLRRKTDRGRWLSKGRRRRGTAPKSNFANPGPSGRRGFRVSLRFCAPEGFCLLQGITPVMGDRGPTPPVRGRCREATEGGRVGEYGHEVSILSRPPAILWFLSHRWERNSPPAGGEIPPCERRNAFYQVQRKNKVSNKVLLVPFLSRKGT